MFEPFQSFLTRASRRYGISQEMQAIDICQSFRKLLPEIFADRTHAEQSIRPGYFKKGVLVIDVESPAWAQEVMMRKPQILESLQSAHAPLKNLRIRVYSKPLDNPQDHTTINPHLHT